ncbi:MAG TPA: zinc ribbon domain-containing protein [Steroidobacteraceae bacterium]|nr:zinc ribbon domain-containing protein [Steroidobacteraceae bacterium]
MPIYEYECSNCKFYVEALQKISEPPLVKCPSCKKQTLKRLVSAPVFRLKGGGWYETDFKSDQEGKRNLAQGEEAEAPAPDKPADDKAEKPAEAAPAADKDKKADKKPAVPTKKAAAKRTSRPPAKTKSKSKAKPKAAARSAKRRR